jgi:hypothetical protein
MTPNANKAIENVYYNLSSAGAYAGPRKIYEILKQNHENTPSLYTIRQWLQSKLFWVATLIKYGCECF